MIPSLLQFYLCFLVSENAGFIYRNRLFFLIQEKGGKPIITMEGGTLDTYEIVLKLQKICGGVDGCSFSIGGSKE